LLINESGADVSLIRVKEPLGRWMEALSFHLFIGALLVGELTQDNWVRPVLGTSKIVEHAGVEDSYTYTVHANVRPKEDVPAVLHDSESDLAHHVAAVFQIAFVQVNLARVDDGVIRRQSFKGDLLVRNFYSNLVSVVNFVLFLRNL